MLRIHNCFNHFPKDARTILKTPTNIISIRIVDLGKYFHIGLLENIKLFINNAKDITKINCVIGIDGLIT